jgi:hypothetical protein
MSSNLKPYADLKVKVREYTDNNDGKTKGVYVKVGTLMASPHLSHMFIVLEAIPIVKDWDGAVSVFKRDDFIIAERDDAAEGTGNPNDLINL